MVLLLVNSWSLRSWSRLFSRLIVGFYLSLTIYGMNSMVSFPLSFFCKTIIHHVVTKIHGDVSVTHLFQRAFWNLKEAPSNFCALCVYIPENCNKINIEKSHATHKTSRNIISDVCKLNRKTSEN